MNLPLAQARTTLQIPQVAAPQAPTINNLVLRVGIVALGAIAAYVCAEWLGG